jgi:catechol 2,3-dioxygenase-like lactoylglutathione lyase family enzyme
MPPPTIGLRHVALTVGDLERAEAFYAGVLGFTVEWRPDPDNLYLTLAGDNLALHRYSPPADTPNHADGDRGQSEDVRAFYERRGQHLDHVGIVVPRPEDVDAWADHLRAHAIALIAEPRTHRDGARSLYCRDPDGNAVQILYHPPISDKIRGS